MKFSEFKKRVEDLALLDEDNMRKIQALMIYFFKNKPMPRIESIQKYVVRCSVNDIGEVFKHVSRCSYNPNISKINMQRCNFSGQQVFYCSMYSDTDLASTSMTCLVETAWEHIEDKDLVRSYFTLSRWGVKRPLHLWVLPFSEDSISKNRDFQRISERMENEIRSRFSNPEDMLEPLRYMSEVFCQRVNKKNFYKLSSAFYNSLLFFNKIKDLGIDGLIYPSSNTEGAGLNVVLSKNLIDESVIECECVTMYAMQRNPSNFKHLTFVPSSNIVFPDEKGRLSFSYIN